MKQFSLEEYLKNPDRKVVTRNGLPVRIICTDRKDKWPIVALVTDDDTERVYPYLSNGAIYPDDSSRLDLMFAPTKKDGWVNIYNRAARSCGLIHESEEKAKLNADKDKPYIATTKIEWEE